MINRQTIQATRRELEYLYGKPRRNSDSTEWQLTIDGLDTRIRTTGYPALDETVEWQVEALKLHAGSVIKYRVQTLRKSFSPPLARELASVR